MSPKIITTAADVRSRYAALFQAIAELAWVRYGERPSTEFEEVKKVSQELTDDGYLNEYLTENLGRLFSLYPELLPGKRHDQKWLDDLYTMLSLIVSDLAEEVKELIDEADAHDAEMLWKSLNG